MRLIDFTNVIYNKLLSTEVKHKGERFILVVAIISYLVHLLLIYLTNKGILPYNTSFLQNPIAAIYTPFSFILVYEVYLLIFFLKRSISFYIGKQYEIITLIVIRRIFKDISNLELTKDWFTVKSDLQFTYDVITSLILFIIIFYFYKAIRKSKTINLSASTDEASKISYFVSLKKAISVLLVPFLIILAVYTLTTWFIASLTDFGNGITEFKNLNNVFFDEFFSVLIVVDMLLLLASFFYSDQFHKIIRNSGFIISTILIKVSFSVEGIINNALIIGAVLFGYLILLVHNKFEEEKIE